MTNVPVEIRVDGRSVTLDFFIEDAGERKRFGRMVDLTKSSDEDLERHQREAAATLVKLAQRSLKLIREMGVAAYNELATVKGGT